MPSRSSVSRCIALLNDLSNSVTDAKKVPFSAGSCIINQTQFLNMVQELKDSLPSAFNTASEYVKNINSIQQQAEQESKTLLRDSQYQSQKAIDEANIKAKETLDQAEQQARAVTDKANADAAAILANAQQQAEQLLANAQREAEAMKERESVLRLARVEASELRETTKQEMGMLRQNTFDYLDGILDQVDRALADTITGLRRERSELNQHR